MAFAFGVSRVAVVAAVVVVPALVPSAAGGAPDAGRAVRLSSLATASGEQLVSASGLIDPAPTGGTTPTPVRSVPSESDVSAAQDAAAAAAKEAADIKAD